jgi:putative ABC transport system permease protein
VLAGIAWLLLRGLRLTLRRNSRTLPAALRHGLANLYRPGNQAQAVLVALGIGVTFIVAIYLIQDSMLEEILASAPPGMPNVFLINITERERDPLIDLLARQPGVTERPEIVGSVAARLVAVNGEAAETLYRDGPARRFLQPRSVTWAAAKPEQTEVVRGTWWSMQAKPEGHQLAITEDVARMLKVEPGAVIAMQASGRRIEASIAVIFRVESLRPGRGIEFVFSPGALDGLPLLYFGGIRVEPRRVAGIQRVVYEKFPAVTVVNVADVIEIVQQVVDQIALVVRFVSFFAILAGVVILASSVAGTRFRRVREVVILKTLGATRGRVAGIFSIEFLLLGSVAGLMGSLLASGFSQIVLTRLLEADFRFDLVPVAAAVAGTALVANLAGWLASFRLLKQKPLEVLRAE